MSTHPPRPHWLHDPEQEAGRWFARLLDPDCGADARAAFERWRNADPTHAAAYREIEALWADGGLAAAQPAVMGAAQAALRGDPHAPRRRWMPALAAAATVLVAVAAWWGVRAWQGNTAPGVRYATATGQQRSVRLADGSTLLLDTDSAVVVHLARDSRRVELLRGRVQFDVYHDAARPFSVSAEDGTVTDVGTVFQMRLDDDAVDVVLLEGAVSITTEADGQKRSASLTGGERLRYRRDGAMGPIEPVDPLVAEGWTHGKLFVHDWTLPQLLAAMNRYSDTKLEIGDPALRSLRISGAFKTGDQQTLLQILHAGWSIRARRTAAGKIVLSRADAATRGHPDPSRR